MSNEEGMTMKWATRFAFTVLIVFAGAITMFNKVQAATERNGLKIEVQRAHIEELKKQSRKHGRDIVTVKGDVREILTILKEADKKP